MSAAATDGTSMTRSMPSRSGPERRAWYCDMQRSFGCRRQAKPGSVAWPQRHGLMAATSWKTRRIGHPVVGAGDHHLAGLERLAQRVERLRVELGELVEEEHAVMGERDLARPGVEAAADERRHRGGVVRRPERPAVRERAVRELAGDRLDHRHFEQLARRQRR